MAAVTVVVDVEEAAEAAVARDWSALPRLGVGLGFRDPYRASVFTHRSQIDFLELIADHFFAQEVERGPLLDLLSRHFPLIPHGLALSLGSADGLKAEYLDDYVGLVNRLEPAWCSDHIAFTHAGAIDIGHLTPLPKTEASLQVLAHNISIVQSRITCPLILENITETIQYPGDQLDEASFLSDLLMRTDTGLLLDVTNLYINSINYRFDPLKVLWRLPAERIIQLHFVGGHWDDGWLIDSHSRRTPHEIWELMEEVLKFAPVRAILLERDEDLPELDELLEELAQARTLMNRYR